MENPSIPKFDYQKSEKSSKNHKTSTRNLHQLLIQLLFYHFRHDISMTSVHTHLNEEIVITLI